LFWANFYAHPKKFKGRAVPHKQICLGQSIYGVDLSGFKSPRKDQILRNMVNPEVGEYIFNTAMGYQIKEEQGSLF